MEHNRSMGVGLVFSQCNHGVCFSYRPLSSGKFNLAELTPIFCFSRDPIHEILKKPLLELLSAANFFGKTEIHLLRPTMQTLSSSVMISRALSRRRLLKYW